MKAEEHHHIVQKDPLEGGGCWYWVAGLLLTFSAAGLGWTARYTYFERRDSLLFPVSIFAGLVGTAFFLFAVWLTLRFRKFGHSFLETEKPVAGAPWKGVVRTSFDLATTGNYVFKLTYSERRYDSFKKDETDVDIWKATTEADHLSVRSSAGVPFEFAPPGPELKKSGSGGTWWLKVTAPMRGLNYLTLFNVTPLLERPHRGRTKSAWGAFEPDAVGAPPPGNIAAL